MFELGTLEWTDGISGNPSKSRPKVTVKQLNNLPSI